MFVNYIEEASFVDDEAQVNVGAAEKVTTLSDVGKSTSGLESETDKDTETPSFVGEETAVVCDTDKASSHRSAKPIAPEEKAIVEEEIRPGEPGRVRFQSTWWPATSEQDMTFQPGETVRVVAIENVTLIVEG